jgi:hypothetical protein
VFYKASITLLVVLLTSTAIYAIDPTPHRGVVPTISPCISDTYYPGTINDIDPSKDEARANVVVKINDHSACPCISLPPAINQPARLNAKFLVKDVDSGLWRSITDWDTDRNNPIVGWLVVNYADNGLQVFLADGTFYREVRLGKRKQVKEPKWLPFDPPSKRLQQLLAKNSKVQQLDYFIDLIANDRVYLQGIFDMIAQAMDPDEPGSSLPHAPKSYATYSSAVVGKPLALVNAGWSLELATDPNISWSTYVDKTPGKPVPDPRNLPGQRALLHDDGSSWPPQYPPQPVPNGQKAGYTFPVKLGDFERNFDGLIGYFPSASNGPTGELDLKSCYTYFTHTQPVPKPQTTDPRIPIAASNYPLLSSYYISSDTPLPTAPNNLNPHDAQLVSTRLGLLLDPFLPTHAYSAILPNKSIKLPPFIVESALKKMTAFWHVGPLLLSADVPSSYNTLLSLDPSTDYSQALPPPAVPLPTVGLPLAAPAGASGGKGAGYRFLQPYWIPDPDATGHETVEQKKMTTRYNTLGIDVDAASGGDASQIRLADGPYTAVEGFVQIAKSIVGT